MWVSKVLSAPDKSVFSSHARKPSTGLTMRLALCSLLLFIPLNFLHAQGLLSVTHWGSANDPAEQTAYVWWRRSHTVEGWGGLSLIGPQWRLSTRSRLQFVTRSWRSRLDATFRTGLYGTYTADFDEFYDVLRLVDFIRYHPAPNRSFYLRLGPLNRTRLGTGHVVDFLNTATAWDERTIGLETAWSTAALDVEAFATDVCCQALAGVRLAFRPFFWAQASRFRSLVLGLSYVRDPALHRSALLEAVNADLALNLLPTETPALVPFFSLAHYRRYGSGLRLGAALQSPNLVDLMAFQLRIGLDYDGKSFLPGYIGVFYPVQNLRARILDPAAYPNVLRYVGVSLPEARGGNGFFTEVHLLFPQGFELWYFFRQHYGSQRLSTFHFRLFLRTHELQLQTGLSRSGLSDLWALFQPMGAQSWLFFETHYLLARPLWLLMQARYTFERLPDAPDGTARYLPQRRFESLIGLRWTL